MVAIAKWAPDTRLVVDDAIAQFSFSSAYPQVKAVVGGMMPAVSVSYFIGHVNKSTVRSTDARVIVTGSFYLGTTTEILGYNGFIARQVKRTKHDFGGASWSQNKSKTAPKMPQWILRVVLHPTYSSSIKA